MRHNNSNSSSNNIIDTLREQEILFMEKHKEAYPKALMLDHCSFLLLKEALQRPFDVLLEYDGYPVFTQEDYNGKQIIKFL